MPVNILRAKADGLTADLRKLQKAPRTISCCRRGK